MRRKIFIFVLFVLSAFFCFNPVEAAQSKLTPITVGDVKRIKTYTAKETFHFIAEYYLKNKQQGATDEEILNELLKLIDLDSEQVEEVKKISLFGKRYKDLEEMVQNAVNDINMSILEKNPGRTDMIVDLSDKNTWKNIKNVYIGNTKIEDYIRNFHRSSYFSKSVSSEKVGAVLASCANMGQENILMSFILFPEKDVFFVTQEEGLPENGIQIDFTGSKNVVLDSMFFPMEETINLNGKKYWGYTEKVYLPFQAKLVNPKEEGTVRAKLTVNTCSKDVCQTNILPEITYTTEKSVLEASFCQNLVQEATQSPKKQNLGVSLKKAVFEKSGKANIDLAVSLKMPFLSSSKVKVLIKNDRGLHFSKPFLMQNGRDLFIMAHLLNPEQLKDQAEVSVAVTVPGLGAEFNVKAPVEQKTFGKVRDIFSFSVLDFIASFLMGIKFFILTPVLMVFLLAVYQLIIVQKQSNEKTFLFYKGLMKMFFVWTGIFVTVFALCVYSSVFGGLVWGAQFNSPLFNYICIVALVFFSFNWKKIFDDKVVENISRRFESVFSSLKANFLWEKAGIITGFAAGILLLITPMTDLYYQTYDLLSRSFIFYSLAFLLGLSSPFLLLLRLKKLSVAFEETEQISRLINLGMPLPLYFQILILLLLIGCETGIEIAAGIILLLCIFLLIIWKIKTFPKKRAIVFPLIGLIFVPLHPSDKNLNNWGSIEFNETLLYRQVDAGKAVYLNVTEDFCLSCLWNRFVMVTNGAANAIQNGDLIVMRIKYNDPFFNKLLPQDAYRSLPMNVIFSPKYPEGKVVDARFEMWSAAQIMEEAFPARKSEPIPQNPPEQNALNPEEKGLN